MSFATRFPEKGDPVTGRPVQAPQIPGQPVYSDSVLPTLRRQQLADLAVAYNVPVNVSGTKAEILPALIEAEKAGVFRQPPKRPEYLVKAQRNPDEPPVDWQSHRPPEMDLNNIKTLREIAKEWNKTAPEDQRVDSFSKSAAEVREMLIEVGAI